MQKAANVVGRGYVRRTWIADPRCEGTAACSRVAPDKNGARRAGHEHTSSHATRANTATVLLHTPPKALPWRSSAGGDRRARNRGEDTVEEEEERSGKKLTPAF